MHKHPVGTTVELLQDESSKVKDAYTASLRMQLAAAQEKDPTGTIQTNPKDNVWVYWANIIGTNIDVPLRQDRFNIISFTEDVYVGYNKLPNFKSYIEFTKW